MVRVLVIDDSAFSRRAIVRMLESSEGIEVVGQARDGEEGLRMLKETRPDVVTLDLDMPKMDGFAFLRIISGGEAVPVLVVSSKAGAANVFTALDLGALDFIPKPRREPSAQFFDMREELCGRVKLLAGLGANRLRRRTQAAGEASGRGAQGIVTQAEAPRPLAVRAAKQAREGRGVAVGDFHLIAIGSSTGGPPALQQVLGGLDGDLPASVVISQHMPAGFTRAFAERLDRHSPFDVKEARQGDLIRTGRALIAPGGKHLLLRRREDVVVVDLEEGTEKDRYIPSIDRMFETASEVFGKRTVGVLLTGMGDDGKKGIVRVKERDGATLAESEESSIVFGMPREAIATGAVDRIVHLDAVAREVAAIVGKSSRKKRDEEEETD